MPDAIVIMGILSFFGLATLITALLNPLLSRIPAFAGLPVSFLLFLLTKEASYLSLIHIFPRIHGSTSHKLPHPP